MKAYDSKTAFLKSVLKTVMDPPGGLNENNLYMLCGANCLCLSNSIFIYELLSLHTNSVYKRETTKKGEKLRRKINHEPSGHG